ncbi:MAG TPA: ribosome-associated translation inhibitor RaiA [Rhizomicrobium sp.]|nr:ribosome-associated translation inhibitor RaiA [Rhizomicrobium sp.]
MTVRVSGKQIDLGPSLRSSARERLKGAIAKHFDGDADVNAVFSHDGPFTRVDCTAHLYSGAVLKAEGEGKDAHQAFDAVLVHLEKQVRRYKRRLKNHHEKTKARERAVSLK